jgi:hypothetical protein
VRPKEHRYDKLLKNLLFKEIGKLENKKKLDFIFYLGCEVSNEKNFIYLNKLFRKHMNVYTQIQKYKNKNDMNKLKQLMNERDQHNIICPLDAQVNIFTCVIGQKATQSMYYINDQTNAIQLFNDLSDPEKLKEALKTSKQGIRSK